MYAHIIKFSLWCSQYVGMDRVKNEEVKQRTEVERKLFEGVDHRVLSCYGHMVRMDEERMTKRV